MPQVAGYQALRSRGKCDLQKRGVIGVGQRCAKRYSRNEHAPVLNLIEEGGKQLRSTLRQSSRNS